MGTRWWRAPTALALLLLSRGGEGAVPRGGAAAEEDGGGRDHHTASRAEGSRPARGSAMLDESEEEPELQEANAAVPGDAGGGPSAERLSATEGIASDMRAHLKRRKKKAQADLIVRNRGPVAAVLFGVGDFLRSKYFANVRKSVGIFVGMWLWYVLNTKTYIPPEFEE